MTPRVAIVHDALVNAGGAERVVTFLAEAFPELTPMKLQSITSMLAAAMASLLLSTPSHAAGPAAAAPAPPSS